MTASLLPSLLAFIAVIAMIPVALWLMKRAQVLRPGAGGPLSIVAGLSMGPRERIAVIQAGGRYLVVGITSQQMSLLADLPHWPGSHSSGPAVNPSLVGSESEAASRSSPDPATTIANSGLQTIPDPTSASSQAPRSPFSRLLRRLDPHAPPPPSA